MDLQALGARLAQPRTRLLLTGAALAGWLGLWWHLGHGPLSLGPHRWDDFRYASRAIEGAFDPGIRNRYVHVWGLRLFYALHDDRLLAALRYAITMGLGLTLCAFAFGKRVGGIGCGLLAAFMLPFYPPLLRYFSAPMCDAPSALYAGLALLAALHHMDRPKHPALPVLAGMLCFAATKSKETGVAVVPVVWWALSQNDARWRSLAYWLSGVVLAQLCLCLLDLSITRDALASLRPRHYQNYAKIVATDPAPYRSGLNHMRHGWVELLLSRDMRAFTLCGVLGLAHGVRRDRTLFALSLWAAGVLLFSAWVSYRYSGIDARIRYMAALALPIVVATAHLLTRLLSGPLRLDAEGTPAGDRTGEAPTVRLRDSPVFLGGVAASAWVAYRALRAGWLSALGAELGFADTRASFFFLPLLVPLVLFIAWTTAGTWIRRIAVPIALCATCLLPIPEARAYVSEWRGSISGWHTLARYMQDHHVDRIARYRVSAGRLHPPLVQWRTRALTHLPGVRERHVDRPTELQLGELLITQKRHRAAAERAGLHSVVELQLGEGRFLVWRR